MHKRNLPWDETENNPSRTFVDSVGKQNFSRHCTNISSYVCWGIYLTARTESFAERDCELVHDREKTSSENNSELDQVFLVSPNLHI